MSDHRKPKPEVVISFAPVDKRIDITDDWYEQQLKLRAVHEAAPSLLAALERMLRLHRMVAKDMNWGASALQAETIQEMNEAPSQAIGAIKKAGGKVS